MNLTWDKSLSSAIYCATKRSAILRPIAMFCATILLFVMLTAVAMTYAGSDPMATMMNRFSSSCLLLGVPVVAAWLVSYVIQRIVRRARPFQTGQGEALVAMIWTGSSFPSAHTAIAFAVAVIGAIANYEMYGMWLFVAAILVSLGRVATGVHYLIDVLVGAFVGIIVGGVSFVGIVFLFFFFLGVD